MDDHRSRRLALRVSEVALLALRSMSLAEHARPHLAALAARTGLAAGVWVLDGQEIELIEHAGSIRWHPGLSDACTPGSRRPVQRTAAGKLLRHAHAQQRRVSCFGISEEPDGVLCAIAAPIHDQDATIAAIEITGSAVAGGVEQLIEDCSRPLGEAAKRISCQLGYDPADWRI